MRLLKGIAIAAGTGLALGISIGKSRKRQVPMTEHLLRLDPLLDRIEQVERRLDAPVSGSPLAVVDPAGAAALADLDRRIEEQTRDLQTLRTRVTEFERRVAAGVESTDRQVRSLREEIPAIVERSVTTRFERLSADLEAERETARKLTMDTIESTIESKLGARIGVIEKALGEQAASIESLRARAVEHDGNLQRLVTAIETLCERANLISPVPGPVATETRLPFEKQMDDMMAQDPSNLPVPQWHVPEPAFLGQMQQEGNFVKKAILPIVSLLVVAVTALAGYQFLH